MKFAYDGTYEPAAPVVQLRVLNPTRTESALVAALVDTGADATVIPENVAEQLELPVVEYAEIAGVGGARREVAIHAAAVSVAGVAVVLKVAAFEDERIVGRDLLSHFVIRLDGPRKALTFEIRGSLRRTPRRR